MSLKSKGKGFITEFRDFIMRGNVIDMAVGVIVATAFGKITTSLVNDVIMPFIGWLIGDIDLSQINITLVEEVVDAVSGEVTQPAVVIGIGTLLVTIIDFLIIAFIVFLIIKIMAKAKSLAEAKKKDGEVVAEEPKAPTTEELLTEILAEMRKDKKQLIIFKSSKENFTAFNFSLYKKIITATCIKVAVILWCGCS